MELLRGLFLVAGTEDAGGAGGANAFGKDSRKKAGGLVALRPASLAVVCEDLVSAGREESCDASGLVSASVVGALVECRVGEVRDGGRGRPPSTRPTTLP